MDNEKSKRSFTNFSNLEKYKRDLVPEEFPEGPLGSPFKEKEPVENKRTTRNEQ